MTKPRVAFQLIFGVRGAAKNSFECNYVITRAGAGAAQPAAELRRYRPSRYARNGRRPRGPVWLLNDFLRWRTIKHYRLHEQHYRLHKQHCRLYVQHYRLYKRQRLANILFFRRGFLVSYIHDARSPRRCRRADVTRKMNSMITPVSD
ncbi:hypothetical protein EVAR_77539_1 [Eumeta japonica]|uniref:Uncharacterized protein n=1 Tax=Eumeta variegata TaxID=151549 RepID=A0A4C1T9Z0_EUMVA|nr:hypothetical protein EVAR_77539_1 [Eumeta japonica]